MIDEFLILCDFIDKQEYFKGFEEKEEECQIIMEDLMKNVPYVQVIKMICNIIGGKC